MNFNEAVKVYRQRSLLPEEQVLADLCKGHEGEIVKDYLEEALVKLLATDVGEYRAELLDWTWQHQMALLEAMFDLAREVVELRVLVADLNAKIGEAIKIAEVVA